MLPVQLFHDAGQNWQSYAFAFVYNSRGYSFAHFRTVGVYATVISVYMLCNQRIDRKVRKNDTYESLQEYQLCQQYEGNNLQQVA